MPSATPPRHLLHIGYPKAGSTFVEAWAASRDDAAFANGGFAGFGAVNHVPDEVGPRPGLRVTSCKALVTHLGPRGRLERYTRGRSPLAFFAFGPDIATRQQRTCETLAALFPTAHVLVVVRGYASMARSMVAQSVREGWTWADADAGAFLDHAADLLAYDRVVSLYEGAFGPGRVTVLPYELLRDDAAAFVAALCEAGAVPYRPFDPGRVNPAVSPYALGLTRVLSGVVLAGTERLPPRWTAWTHRGYLGMLRRVRTRSWFERAGRALGVAPVPRDLFPREALRAAFAGRAEAVARRPEVAPYAHLYTLGP